MLWKTHGPPDVWLHLFLKMLQQDEFACMLALHFCKFHARWRKPTALLGGFIDFTALGRVRKGNFQCRSATGKLHIPLHGLASDGRLMTSVAQPYPYKLVNDVACILKTELAAR